ncbi:MAG: acyltransferase [Actinomycetota bacterium]|nr:acyltransferase [Actinomycetota bacterium]
MSGAAHETAIVEPGATVGDGTRIWHHSHVRAGASIGADSSLGKNVYVDSDVTIGSRVKIQNNVSVYHGVTVGDDVFLGPSCVFTNDRYPRAAGADWQVVPTQVAQGASVGANATVVCGVTLGEWCVVGAGAVVTRDVLSHQLVLGNPARPAGWVCRCGRVVSRDPQQPPPSLQCPECAGGEG